MGDTPSTFGTALILLGLLVPLHISISDFGSRIYIYICMYGRTTVVLVNKLEHCNITKNIRTFLIAQDVQGLVDIRRI